MQAQCFAREGRVLALESGGERLLLGPRACFDGVAPQLLIQDEAAMRMALGGFLRESHAQSRLASWVGTVEGGGLFDSWRYGADQAVPRVAAMAQSGAIAGMIVPLGQGDAPTPQPATDTGTPAGPVSAWSLEARFRYVLTHMPAYLSGEARQAFSQLLEPAALATTVAVLVVWAGSHAVGVGFIADAALLGIGFALVGWAIFDAIGALADFFHHTLSAQSTDDLDKAAQSLARCVTTIGVGALIALLTRGAGRLMSRGGSAGGGSNTGPGSTDPVAPAPRTPTEVLAANRAAGKVAEAQAAKDLIQEGNQILGSQVTMRTSLGDRIVDHVIQTPDGRIMAVEVKSGNAVRNASQMAKDALLASEGGVFVGRNAPPALRGTQVVIDTIERHY